MIPFYPYLGEEKVCKKIPLTFPPQHQNSQPGMEYLMSPKPVSQNPSSTGSNKLQNKVAIVTGGDSGIGRAISYAFAKEGADIAISYLNEQIDAEETKNEVEQLGRKCILLPGDLKKEATSKYIVEEVIKTFGCINILINNQAVQFVQKGIEDISSQQLEFTFHTNVFPMFYLTKAVLPYLSCGSTIVNTTSITAFEGSEELIDYSATKGAIVSFTKSLAKSLIKRGIRVNAVAPGPVWTPLIPASFSAKQIETFGTDTSKVPMMRAAQPFEIAASYVFLASDDSSYMTGHILHPDGGK